MINYLFQTFTKIIDHLLSHIEELEKEKNSERKRFSKKFREMESEMKTLKELLIGEMEKIEVLIEKEEKHSKSKVEIEKRQLELIKKGEILEQILNSKNKHRNKKIS